MMLETQLIDKESQGCVLAPLHSVLMVVIMPSSSVHEEPHPLSGCHREEFSFCSREQNDLTLVLHPGNSFPLKLSSDRTVRRNTFMMACVGKGVC